MNIHILLTTRLLFEGYVEFRCTLYWRRYDRVLCVLLFASQNLLYVQECCRPASSINFVIAILVFLVSSNNDITNKSMHSPQYSIKTVFEWF